MDVLPSKGRISQSQRVAGRIGLLTIHDSPHILDKAIDSVNNLQCGDPTLVRGESIQPFQYQLIVIPCKDLLYRCP